MMFIGQTSYSTQFGASPPGEGAVFIHFPNRVKRRCAEGRNSIPPTDGDSTSLTRPSATSGSAPPGWTGKHLDNYKKWEAKMRKRAEAGKLSFTPTNTLEKQEAAKNGTLKPSFSITGKKRKQIEDSSDLVPYSPSQVVVLPETPSVPAIEYPTRLALPAPTSAQSLPWATEDHFLNSTPVTINNKQPYGAPLTPVSPMSPQSNPAAYNMQPQYLYAKPDRPLVHGHSPLSFSFTADDLHYLPSSSHHDLAISQAGTPAERTSRPYNPLALNSGKFQNPSFTAIGGITPPLIHAPETQIEIAPGSVSDEEFQRLLLHNLSQG